MQTINRDNENESNSAAVNRPHIPNENLLPSEQGRVMYWHMGNRRKAKATVAITKNYTPFQITIYIISFAKKISFIAYLLFY